MMILRMVTVVVVVVVVTVDFIHATELSQQLMRMRVEMIMMTYDLLWMIVLVVGMMKMIAEVNMGIVCQGC